jgi:tetratricopeptide (TPR) repeat protein
MRSAFALALVSAALFAQSPTFDDIAGRAAEALERGDASEAIRLYRQCVELRPSWAEGWFYLGAAEYQTLNIAQARAALDKAAELAPDNGAVWALMGLVESNFTPSPQALAHIVKGETLGLPDDRQFIQRVRLRAAGIAIHLSDFTAAIDQLRPLAMSGDRSRDVIEAFGIAALTRPYLPNEIPAADRPLIELAGRAAWNFYAQNWSDADPAIKELGDRFPDAPGVHYLRGIYFIGRDLAAARAEFQQEIKIVPSHALARTQLAILHLLNGEPAAALPYAQEAVKLAPDNLLSRVTLGRALYDLNRIPAAIREFQAALKLQPSYPHTHFYLSQAYRKAGREEEARKEQAEFARLKDAGSPTAGAGLPIPQK